MAIECLRRFYDFLESDFLFERQKLLNEKFVWTEDARKQILLLNEKIFACEKLLHEEYAAKKKELEDRESRNDKFLTDYNISMKLELWIYTPNKDGELDEPEEGTIYSFINDKLHVHADMIPRKNYNNEELLNWNDEMGKLFENDFLHYAFHCMCDHEHLAWEDILKINYIWSEVNVDYQRGIDLFVAETSQK